VLTSLIFVLQSSIPWEMLPKEMGCGSGMSCWRRLHAWQEAGVWDRLLLATLRAAPGTPIRIQNPVHRGAGEGRRQRVERIVLAARGPEPIREPEEILLVDRVQHINHRASNNLVLPPGNPQRALLTVRLRYVPPPDG
jgi:transposase